MSNQPATPTSESKQQVIGQDDIAEPTTRAEQEKQRASETFNKAENKNDVNMHVKVYSPSKVYFDGLALSVSATNNTGEFDILPKHHPFISLLSASDLIVRSVKDHNHRISISGGLMHVKADKIIVFLDI